jgi:hypothetical protein
VVVVVVGVVIVSVVVLVVFVIDFCRRLSLANRENFS